MNFNVKENISLLTGKKFGRLTLIKYMGRAKDRKHTWLCLCECGAEIIALENNIKNGHTKSCGCISREKTIERNKTHGLRNNPLYRTWANMKQRCNNPKHRDYHRYGGRGISICKEWGSSKKFINWCYRNGYSEGLTLDRKDNDGNYEPENCRFVSMGLQCCNKSNNIIVEHNGEIKTLTQWARELPVCYTTLRKRYCKGERGDSLLRPGLVGGKR